MQSLTQPTLLLKPFAESGDKNSIPVTNTDASNPQLADLTNGFPQVTSEDPDDGGLPPERKDINGLGYLTTTYDYFYQAGGTFTFNSTISSAIGGYPLGARLWYTDSNGATTVVRSTIANNTDNFNDGSATGIGATWVPEIPALGWNNNWTGNNTFSGTNAFTGNILSKGGLNKVLDVVLGVNPSELKAANYGVYDKNGVWLGGWESYYDTDGTIKKQISVKKQDSSNNYAIFEIGYTGQGKEFMHASPGVTSAMNYYGEPNYAAMVSKSDNVAYTADTNGFIIWQPKIVRGYNKYTLTIESQQIGYGGNEDWTNNCLRVVYPIRKGATYSSSGSSAFYFAPAVGG